MRRCLLLSKLCSISSIKVEYDVKAVEVISNLLHSVINKIGLTPKHFQKKLPKLFRKYENQECTYYADLTLNTLSCFKIEDFKPIKKAKFEDNANIPNNQEATLGQVFGDYMQLPPEEERIGHGLNEVDFGKY